MADTTRTSELSHLNIWQQRLSIITWLVTLLLSLRGLYEFYGMKVKGSFEQAVFLVTDPVARAFDFNFLHNLDIPAIGICFATISILLISSSMQLFLKFIDRHYLWTRDLLFYQALAVAYAK
jgi:hypothetical protein